VSTSVNKSNKLKSEDLSRDSKRNSFKEESLNSLQQEYSQMIYHYLKEREEVIYGNDDDLNKQGEITDKFRDEMLEWMINTQLELRLSNEALFLAFSIISRYLRRKQATQYEFLMLCFSSLNIASKYCKHHSPHLKDFLAATSNLVSKSEAIKMELTILQIFHFDISFPTVFDFLQRFKKLMNMKEIVFNLAVYICELQAMNLSMTVYAPSLQAVSGLYLAEKAIDKTFILTNLPLSDIAYDTIQIEQCARDMLSNVLIKKESAIILRKHRDVIGIVLKKDLLN